MADPSKDDPVQASVITGGRGVRIVMETSGAMEARKAALTALAPWGTLCLIAGEEVFRSAMSAIRLMRQISIVASWTFSNVGQAECARFVTERKIPVDKVFTHRWALDQGR